MKISKFNIFSIFRKTSFKKQSNKYNEQDYQKKLSLFISNKRNTLLKENLINYINLKFDNKIDFFGSINLNQEDFLDFLYYYFYNYSDTIKLLKCEKESYNNILIKLNNTISLLHESYKEYYIGLAQFYIDNPKLSHALRSYPYSTISKGFCEYIKEDLSLLHYNKETKTLLYLKLIEELIFGRFLELNKEQINNLKKGLTIFKNNENNEISKISKKIINKLYRYNGVKCPSHLIYISLFFIFEKKAEDLTKYAIKYFEEGTSIKALELAFKGRLLVIPEGKYFDEYYLSNPNFSSPLIIKYSKLGYLSYIYEYLEINGYIVHDKKWHSIAKYKYYKYRKKDGNIEFVSPNKFSQTLSYKKQRLSTKKMEDKELTQLIEFLNLNFKPIKE